MTNELAPTPRHCLVCGASAGIGRAAALALAKQGCNVTVLARREPELAALLPELRTDGAESAEMVVADLQDLASLRSKTLELLSKRGPIHVLVNNAGGPPSGRLLDASAEEFLRAFERHLFASHLLVGLCLPGMTASGFGRIINVISTSVREPIPGLGVSNTLRGAMASWAKSLSRELPPGVTINNVLPGFTATGRLAELAETIAARSNRSGREVEADWKSQVPEGRLGRPAEIGWAIAMLASPEASYIRGVSLPVDGGRLRSI